MDEAKLLEYKIKSIEQNILVILKDINNRLNKLEDEVNANKISKKKWNRTT